MKLATSLKTLAAALTCLVAFSSNGFASVSVEDAKSCGLNFEHCTDTCPAKRCSGNDLNVCKYAFEDCLRQHDAPDIKK